MRPAYPFPAVPAVGGVSWPAALAALALTLVVLGFAFTTEITAALDTWESSTAYNHCWLVLPVALWLAWARRDRLRGLQPEPWMPGVAGVLLAGLAWLMAERLGIMEGRQLAVLGMVWGLVLSVLGWPVVRAMAAPLLYLVFLVPFGEFMTPLLQRWTAWFIVTGLNMLSIPNYPDDLVIEGDGQRVLIDSTSLPFLANATIDFSDELIGARFTVENPNATSSCGCGTSFSI